MTGPSTKLGRIERIPIRDFWKHEAADFTPWLEENIGQLGEVLGMDLEVVDREAQVGGFSLDLLAKDLSTGSPVIIENQLEPTDHKHLGQLLTYAAGKDAAVIIWIAQDFREEHRAAMDFLNARTGEDTEFFGVRVELWKIDDSLPAAHFDLVVAPNEWSKRSASAARLSHSGREETYRQFWQPLVDALREKHQLTKARQGPKFNFFQFSSGLNGVLYGAAFGHKKRIRVEIVMDSGDRRRNKERFDRLEAQKEEIESDLGELSWQRMPDKDLSCIVAHRDGSVDSSEEDLEEIRQWMIERLLDFQRVFGQRLADL